MSLLNKLSGYSDDYEKGARLTILKALAEDQAATMNDRLLMVEVERFGYNRDRDWLITQLTWLQDQAGAVTLRVVGSVVVATLTETGLSHLKRKTVLSGIAQPSLPG